MNELVGNSPRRSPRRRRSGWLRHRRLGFSFIEVVVVVAIIGLIVILSTGVYEAIKRARLEGVAGELAVFANRALDWMHRENLEVFLIIGAQDTVNSPSLGTPVYIVPDSDRDGVPVVPADTATDICGPAGELTSNPDQSPKDRWCQWIPSWVVLAPQVATSPEDTLYSTGGAPKTAVASENWWISSGPLVIDTDDATKPRVLRLTLKGLTTLVGEDDQVEAPARLALTHRDMQGATPKLTPQTVYVLRINPLWHANVIKGVWDGQKFAFRGRS